MDKPAVYLLPVCVVGIYHRLVLASGGCERFLSGYKPGTGGFAESMVLDDPYRLADGNDSGKVRLFPELQPHDVHSDGIQIFIYLSHSFLASL